MLSSDIIALIKEDLPFILNSVQEFSMQLLALKVTKYPIFVLHAEPDVRLGIKMLDADVTNCYWNVSSSHLEDFVNKKVIEKEKVNAFRESYKNPAEYACFFVLTEGESGFIYYPYTK